MFIHVTAVEYVGDYKLQLRFNNGTQGIVDLEQELYGEIFEPLRDKTLFQQVFITNRTIEWPNGADFAPEFLFEMIQENRVPENEQPLQQTRRRKAQPRANKKQPVLLDT